MPTRNRRAFVPQAVEYFLRQDYALRELIVVDDGDDAIADLLPLDARIRYTRLNRRQTVGAKRNIGCELAAGEIIVNWDDDDWMADRRLRQQVGALRQTQSDLCGLQTLLAYDLIAGQAWRYVCPPEYPTWLAGSTVCFTKALWRATPFPDRDAGAELRFIWGDRSKKTVVLPDYTLSVAMRHAANTTPMQSPAWQPYSIEAVRRIIGTDWPFYTQLASQLNR